MLTQNIRKHVVIIGGGIAGTEASIHISRLGFSVTLIEKSDNLGGKLNRWDRLFPYLTSASEIRDKQIENLNSTIRTFVNTSVTQITQKEKQFKILLSNQETLVSDAIVIATGFELFNAKRKEEYGYGIYDNVITSADLEDIFRERTTLKTKSGKIPKRIGIIHCVGSRDEKTGNSYCSKVCCITAVKQAIEIKEHLPGCEVFCFYMDLRMFDRHYEEIFKKAQTQYNIQFIRGRLSEAFENPDGSIILKAEDTLLNRPIRMNVDLVVLMVGMVPSSPDIFEKLNLKKLDDGFIDLPGGHYQLQKTAIPGIFTAGACTGPKTIENTLTEARAVALEVSNYLIHG